MHAEPGQQQDTKRRRALLRPATILFVLAVALCVFFAFAYFRSARTLHKLDAQSPDQQEQALVKKISAHLLLPAEKPTIATVENVQKLAGQTFFKQARDGDKVLMYTQSKKAILYRPSQDKVIEIAYLNINPAKQPPQ